MSCIFHIPTRVWTVRPYDTGVVLIDASKRLTESEFEVIEKVELIDYPFTTCNIDLAYIRAISHSLPGAINMHKWPPPLSASSKMPRYLRFILFIQ